MRWQKIICFQGETWSSALLSGDFPATVEPQSCKFTWPCYVQLQWNTSYWNLELWCEQAALIKTYPSAERVPPALYGQTKAQETDSVGRASQKAIAWNSQMSVFNDSCVTHSMHRTEVGQSDPDTEKMQHLSIILKQNEKTKKRQLCLFSHLWMQINYWQCNWYWFKFKDQEKLNLLLVDYCHLKGSCFKITTKKQYKVTEIWKKSIDNRKRKHNKS